MTGFARGFAHEHWSLLGPGSQKNCCGTHMYKSYGEWDHVAEDMMFNFSESGHPVFRGSGASKRGSLRRKGSGTFSINFCGDTDAVEVVLRTIICVNQLCVHGAAADMCDELTSRISDCSGSTGRLVAELKSEIMVVPTDLSTTTKPLENTNENSQIVQPIFG